MSNFLSFWDMDLQSAKISTYLKCIPQVLAYLFRLRSFALSSEGGEDFFFVCPEPGLVCFVKEKKDNNLQQFFEGEIDY